MANVTSATKHFPTAKEGFTTTLASTISSGATTVPLNSVSGFSNGETVVLIVDPADASKKQTFTGVVDTSGVQLTSVVWTEGTNQTHTSGSTVVDYETATHWALYSKGLLVEHNQAGTHSTALITSRTEDTSPDPDEDFILTYDTSAAALKKVKPANLNGGSNGWIYNVLPAVSGSPTYNGNRSTDITFASSVASTLSPGMRLEITKTVAGNGYMGGAFNGSSHYFTKTSPSGTLGTVTNNFTIEAVVMPTSYALGRICGRSDATPNNGFALMQEADGRVTCIIYNAGSGNYRSGTTYQSLPLNKKTTVAVTYSSAVTGIYFDGVSVPFSVTSGGTNPTTAGTGGDFSIGRMGAYAAQYFPGYISNVAVFDAVLSAATIKAHSQIKLLGSETNCIGAWSLDNTAVNQQAPGTNDLTATGGVGYTAISPHGQLGDAVQTTKAVALVMAVSGSTVTVQTPEGVTIPTSGGITSVAFATNGNPFGFPASKARWAVTAIQKVLTAQGAPGTSTWYNLGGLALTVPVGSFSGYYKVACQADRSGGAATSAYATLSTSSSAESTSDHTAMVFQTSATGATSAAGFSTVNIPLDLEPSSATAYYLLLRAPDPASNLYIRGDVSTTRIALLPAGL